MRSHKYAVRGIPDRADQKDPGSSKDGAHGFDGIHDQG
jgi:hypothetical protein